MKVFAIDPGPEISAFVVWDGKTILAKDISNNDRLLEICLSGLSVDWLVVEKIMSFGMPVSTSIFDTVFWSGRFCQAWTGKFDRISRLEVKMHLCHDSRARDSNIRQALIDRFGKPGTKRAPGLTYGLKKDLWAAFAVAVTFYDNASSRGQLR